MEDKKLEKNEIEEEIIENNDPLNIYINVEDVKDLTEDECLIVSEKIEAAIDKYEDILMMAQREVWDENELVEKGFDEQEYKRLKILNKTILKHIKVLRKGVKENGFFGNLPIISVIISIIIFLLTIYPINPLLPVSYIITPLIGKLNLEYSISILVWLYVAYCGILFIPSIVILIVLYIKGLKNKEKMISFKAHLLCLIINIIAFLPGLIIFINVIKNI